MFDGRTLNVVGQLTGPDDIVDSKGHLAKPYGPADHTFVLIRPDGYVALISDGSDISVVSAYFAVIG